MRIPGDRPISVVLLGYGLGGRVFHGPLISVVPGLSLDAIVTGNADRQQQAHEAYPEAAIYATAEEAWAGGHDLAAISVANVGHVPTATSALEHGLHVVLDKPVAPSAEAARRLMHLATSHGRQLIPFHNRRWDSDFLTARKVAAQGELGRIHRYESAIQRMRVTPKGGWRESAAPGDVGGQLLDLGAHVVDQAIHLMGPVHTVMASARSVRNPSDANDDVTFLLEHVSGAVSHLVVSQVAAFADPRIMLLGTRGGLRIDAVDSQESELASGRLPDASDWGQEPVGTDAELRLFDDASARTVRSVPLERGDWPAFYRGVEAALRGSEEPPVLIEDAVATMRVLDAARESALANQVVTLDPPAGHRASSMS